MKQVYHSQYFKNSPEKQRQFLTSLKNLSVNVDFMVILDMLNDSLADCDLQNRNQLDNAKLRQTQGASQILSELIDLNRRAKELIHLNR